MKKRILLLGMLSLFLFITVACSEDKITPNDRFDSYIENWHKYDFEKMYQMLADEALDTYPTEDFIDRYKKIYEDLEITDLTINFEELNEDKLESAFEEGEATIPFSVEMESIAGPITFDYEATLTEQGEDENYNWFINWDPGFIFPALKDGGSIEFQTTLPDRGEIMDRNNMPLALNDNVYEIGIVPERLGENPGSTKEQIGKLLNMSVDSIDTKLNANWVQPDQFVPITKLPKTKQDIVDQLLNLDGILLREVTGRVYPSGEAAAHLIGYIGQITAEELEEKDSDVYSDNDMIGKRGLEQIFEEQLKGEKGLKIIISNEDEEDVVLAEKPVKHGETITLTIDANIQDKVFDSYDGEAGTAAAIDPKTGETLALVSSPGFDPNDFLYGISQSKWDQLNNDPQAPLLNRFSATYAPGSSIKPITGAIGLENGTIDPDEGIEIKGLTWSNGKGWGDYEVRRVSQTDKPVDLADALMRSDNIYFAMQAVKMGSKSFIEGLEGFGFGEAMPLEYPIKTSTISSSGTLNGEVEVANTSYGQAQIEISALHLALTYTPFLNEGNMIKPTILLDSKTGEVWREKLITPEHATLMQKMLRDVVAKGTAKTANHEELAISGKTGTAELKLSHDAEGHENGWFVGYPTEEQDILISLMIEHAEDIGTSGLAAEKVANILLELK